MNKKPIFYFDDVMRQTSHLCQLVDANDGYTIKGFLDGNDFNLGVSHSFEAAGSGGALGKFRNIYESLRPMIMRKSLMTGDAIQRLGKNDALDDFSPAIAEQLRSIGETISSSGPKFLGNHLETADDYMYLFKGTSITVPTSFEVLLISDGDPANDIYNTWRGILNRFVGDYTVMPGGYIGVQEPPNKYEPSLEALKEAVDGNYKAKGTFVLHIGDHNKGGWRFPGIVVNDLNHTISKVTCEIAPGVFRPLYVQIRFTLQQVKKLVKSDITSNLGG